MRRICSECKKEFGEKCGVCGSTNLAIERHADLHPEVFPDLKPETRRLLLADADRFLCLDCGEMHPRGFGGNSHGYCEPCKVAFLEKNGLAAKRNGTPAPVEIKFSLWGRIDYAWRTFAVACNRLWAWFSSLGIGQ
jgi:hypothetical protein